MHLPGNVDFTYPEHYQRLNAVGQKQYKTLWGEKKKKKSKRTKVGTVLAQRPEREALEAGPGPAEVRRAREQH